MTKKDKEYLLNLIKEMKEKGYEAETILESIELNLRFNFK